MPTDYLARRPARMATIATAMVAVSSPIRASPPRSTWLFAGPCAGFALGALTPAGPVAEDASPDPCGRALPEALVVGAAVGLAVAVGRGVACV